MVSSTETIKTELYNSGFFNPIVEECEGCDRIIKVNNNKYCKTYAFPEAKWRLGLCNFATHKKLTIKGGQKKVNPIKSSKRR
ncbi:MAG: PxxKW family cysteine-rich protein [Thermodesulfobacteriota bacterium]